VQQALIEQVATASKAGKRGGEILRRKLSSSIVDDTVADDARQSGRCYMVVNETEKKSQAREGCEQRIRRCSVLAKAAFAVVDVTVADIRMRWDILLQSSQLYVTVTSMSRQEILRAYRDLYKQSLRTVRYSTPARYSARDILRASFRDNLNPSTSFKPKRIANTLNFLERAVHYNGYEHKIIKNLLLIRWWRTRNAMGLHRNM
jgi:hypothetical protein